MFLPWYEMRTALLRAIVARHELQLSGRRPCATRSLLISVCWYDPIVMGGAAADRVTGAAFGAGAGAWGGLGGGGGSWTGRPPGAGPSSPPPDRTPPRPGGGPRAPRGLGRGLFAVAATRHARQ